MSRSGLYVLGFDKIAQTRAAIVGGKGAHVGELSLSPAHPWENLILVSARLTVELRGQVSAIQPPEVGEA